MKRLSKKWIIILSILLAVAITLTFILYNKFRGVERSYIAYVDINPLIKLNFNTTCKQNVCNEPIITDYELINEDAKTIYKDLVLNDKTLKETIELLANTVNDNEIAFKEVRIYTNYENEDYFKLDSIDYDITLNIKKDNEFETFIDELIVKKENIKTKEVLVPISFPRLDLEAKYVEEVIPLEQQDKFTSITKTVPFEKDYEIITKICIFGFNSCQYDISTEISSEYEYVKTAISGPQELIDTIPYEIPTQDGVYIAARLNLDNHDIGTHEATLEFISYMDELEILTKPIRVQVEIIDTSNYKIIETTEDGKAKYKYNKDVLDDLRAQGIIP